MEYCLSAPILPHRLLKRAADFATLGSDKFIHAFQYPSGFKGKQVKFLCTANAVKEKSASLCHWVTLGRRCR